MIAAILLFWPTTYLKELPMPNKLIDALNQTIKAQSELIIYLKAEIERLKTSTVYIGPNTPNTLPPYQGFPWYTTPGVTIPNTPGYPYTITGTQVGNITCETPLVGTSTNTHEFRAN